jgi:hypothetical protein
LQYNDWPRQLGNEIETGSPQLIGEQPTALDIVRVVEVGGIDYGAQAGLSEEVEAALHRHHGSERAAKCDIIVIIRIGGIYDVPQALLGHEIDAAFVARGSVEPAGAAIMALDWIGGIDSVSPDLITNHCTHCLNPLIKADNIRHISADIRRYVRQKFDLIRKRISPKSEYRWGHLWDLLL